MKRFAVTLATLALAGTTLQAAGTDPNLDYNVLQGRIASLESKVKMLETALNELSAQVAKPTTTLTSSPAPAPAPPSKTLPVPEAPKAPPVEEAPKTVSAPPVTEPERYYIQEGDTISEIARKLGVPRTELMEANNLREGQQIYIGDPLMVPQPEPVVQPDNSQKLVENQPSAPSTPSTPAPAPSGASTSYTVKMGDTLTKIAREHGVTVTAIKSANGMKSDLITGGQTLKIPGASKKSGNTVASNTPTPASGGSDDIDNLLRPDEEYGVYTVEKGDTLYSLARDFFTTQAEIQRLNRMGHSTTLRPGQDLVVPTSKYQEHHNLADNG